MDIFKVGDKVKCKIGYNTDGGYVDDKSGGAGYRLDEILTISRFSNNNNQKNDIAWFEELNGKGIYLQALELADQEIQYEIC